MTWRENAKMKKAFELVCEPGIEERSNLKCGARACETLRFTNPTWPVKKSQRAIANQNAMQAMRWTNTCTVSQKYHANMGKAIWKIKQVLETRSSSSSCTVPYSRTQVHRN